MTDIQLKDEVMIIHRQAINDYKVDKYLIPSLL